MGRQLAQVLWTGDAAQLGLQLAERLQALGEVPRGRTLRSDRFATGISENLRWALVNRQHPVPHGWTRSLS
jgi:hypothetical protein